MKTVEKTINGTTMKTQAQNFDAAIARAMVTKTSEEKKWRSELCDDCCLACEAWTARGGKCRGVEHMTQHDEAVDAINEIARFFNNLPIPIESELLSQVSEAVSWLDPSLENPHLDDPSGAMTVLLELEEQADMAVDGSRCVIPTSRYEENAAETTFSQCGLWFDPRAPIDVIKRLFEMALEN